VTIEGVFDGFYANERIREKIKAPTSFFSQIYHFVAFRLEAPKTQLQNGMLVISIDVDVGKKKLGMVNRGKNDANVNRHMSEYRVGKIEEQALPLFVDLFNSLKIPVTFALRGQLVEVNSSVFDLFLNSSVKHDIGAHGYYHRQFKNLSRNEAESELGKISIGMRKLGVLPRSFVFPNNSVAHLDILEKYGYKCYRGYGDFMNDCMYIEKRGGLYNIHPSLYVDRHTRFAFFRRILDISVMKKLPFHVWFHLWNFGETKKSIENSINKLFFPLLNYAKKIEEMGLLTFETMLSATEKCVRAHQ